MAAQMAQRYNHPNSSRNLSTKSSVNRRKGTVAVAHVRKRRQPFKLIDKREHAIFVSSSTPFKAQLVKCEKLLDSVPSQIVIHGLGAAINRACNLALRLKEIHRDSLDLDIRTSTENLVDDLEPLSDEGDYEVANRNNSGIHIRVFRKTLTTVSKRVEQHERD